MSRKLDEKISIGKRIWQEAEKQQLTKADFSKKMDISRQTLDNWINGDSAPDYYKLELASKILGVAFWPESPPRSFKDEIFEGDYIGMHKKVWATIEHGIYHEREEAVKKTAQLDRLTVVLDRAVQKLGPSGA